MARILPLEEPAIDWERFRRDVDYCRRVEARHAAQLARRDRDAPPTWHFNGALAKMARAREDKQNALASEVLRRAASPDEAFPEYDALMQVSRDFWEFHHRVVQRVWGVMTPEAFLEVMESEADFWRPIPEVCRLVERTAEALRNGPATPVVRRVLPFPAPR